MSVSPKNTFNWYDFSGASGYGSGGEFGSGTGSASSNDGSGNFIENDQVAFQGGSADYIFVSYADGSLSASSDQGMNLLMNIEAVFFEETEEWAATEDLA